jgi:hypothetical protein
MNGQGFSFYTERAGDETEEPTAINAETVTLSK